MQVSQSHTFTDSLKQATSMGLLDATAGGMVVYPTFARRSSSEDDSPRDPSGPPQDPRQRFFECAGQQMVQDEREFPQDSHFHNRLVWPLLAAVLSCNSAVEGLGLWLSLITQYFCPGLEGSPRCGPFTSLKARRQRASAAWLAAVQALEGVDAKSEALCTEHCRTCLKSDWRYAEPSVSGREAQSAEGPALFLRRQSTGRLWFNTSLIRSTRRQQQYRWAGWLLGQSFANRASLCAPLPELLFEKLLQTSFQVPAHTFHPPQSL